MLYEEPIEHKGYKIKVWCDSVLASMPPIPVYKADTDRIKIGPIESTNRDELVQAIKDEIDKREHRVIEVCLSSLQDQIKVIDRRLAETIDHLASLNNRLVKLEGKVNDC